MTKSKGFFRSLVGPWFSNASRDQNEDDLERIAAQEQKLFSFETLVAATKNFHSGQKLGEGAFGPVFKGKLADGKEVAVKKLSHSSLQVKKEFKTVAKLLVRVQHRNVVNLLGYCVHGEENLLVYEYVVHESLDKHLFRSDKREAFNWKRRLDLITGIAKGLFYLHEQAHFRIIHRDVKPSNILIDDKWVPKISDFGMAHLFPEDQTHNTRVAGTNGYMAPEYLMHGSLSVKADVFSFGVVVLELISGEKNSPFTRDPDSKNLLEWAYKLYKKQRALEIMDPALASSTDPKQIAMCIHMGLLCVQSDPQSRPDMGRVIMILSIKSSALEEPSRPGYPGSRYRRNRTPGASSSGTGNSVPRNSQSFGSTSKSASSTSSSSDYMSTGSDPHGKRPMRY